MSWHVILTKPNAEMKVTARIARIGFQPFLPLCRLVGARIKTERKEPLFRGYVFVDIGPTQQWTKLQYVPGVRQLMLERYEVLATLPEEAILDMRRRMDMDGGQVAINVDPPRPDFRDGDKVRITGGPLAGFEGLYVPSEDDRIHALVGILGRQTKIALAYDQVAKS